MRLAAKNELEIIASRFGEEFAWWLLRTGRLLRVSVFPASVFVLTRDLLMCPVQQLPSWGVAGLASLGLHPMVSARPFSGFSIVPFTLVDRVLWDFLPDYMPAEEKVRKRVAESLSVAKHVSYLFSISDEDDEAGASLFDQLVSAKKFFPVAKKRGA